MISDKPQGNNMQQRKPSAAVFVDVQNIYYTCRDAYQKSFDYRKFWRNLEQEFAIVHAFAYATSSKDDGQHKFQKALRHIGFDVKLKPFIQRSDGSAKGDWDVGITLDVMEFSAKVDHIILLSGDGDFDLLLQRVKQKYNTITHVYGAESLTAYSLKQACDHFHPIGPDQLL